MCAGLTLRAFLAGLLALLGVLASGAGHASEGAQVQNSRTLRVGIYANAPKIFQDDTGLAVGILPELLDLIARAEGWQLEYVPCIWQKCLEALERGELDLMPDVALNETREKLFDFHTSPALTSWSQIYARSDQRIESTFDLDGKRIAVLGGSVQEKGLRDLVDGFALNTKLTHVTTLDEGFALAQLGKVNGVVSNVFFGDYHAERYKLAATTLVFQPARLFFAVQQGQHADVLAAIDKHLDAWRADPDSAYFSTLNKWRGGSTAGAVPRQVWQGIAVLSTILIVALALAVWLRRQVRLKVEHLKAVLDAIPDLMFEFDADGRYHDYHSPRSDLLPVPARQFMGRTVSEVLPAEAAAQVMASLRAAAETGYGRGHTFYLDLHNGRRWFELSVKRKTPAGHPSPRFVALARDITERRQAEENIHQLAFHDPLTGLPNRRLMLDRLGHALTNHERLQRQGALLMIDLDNFKLLNDTMGHDIGDQLLLEVATRLSSCLREGDTAARLGGDEFVVILEGLDANVVAAAAQAETVASKIKVALEQPSVLHIATEPGAATARQHQSTASIGVCLFGAGGDTVEALMKHADTAMYQAKDDGRNQVRFFDPAMEQALAARAALERDLAKAIADDQLLLHYQPQVRRDGRVLGAEALLRWQHPGLGMVSPAQFIPLAEQSGLILPIGQWVLETACRQLVTWATAASTEHLTLAVNVSAHQLRQADFVDAVTLVLARTGANPVRLKLELTESLLVTDIESIIGKMTQLKALGIGFSLDDFGTGYSSLNYLRRLPLDQLKIDQSFVRDVLSDAGDASIARTIVALGQSLGLHVIAEGVETEAQRDFLAANGCLTYQGYFFSRPLTIADFALFIARTEPTS
jgi:diguanylate cyclase (GGDEF)-like protein/PAS domain S-box-containing protein